MLLILDVDYTLNHFYPPSIHDFAPPELVGHNNPQLWDWIIEHLSTTEYPVHETAVAVLERLNRCQPLVVVSTGRPEALRAVTERWLRQFFQFEHVFMRPKGDCRLNAEIKRDVLTQTILPLAQGRTVYAFEDDASALEMYRESGVRTFVAPGCWQQLHTHLGAEQDQAALRSALDNYVLP